MHRHLTTFVARTRRERPAASTAGSRSLPPGSEKSTLFSPYDDPLSQCFNLVVKLKDTRDKHKLKDVVLVGSFFSALLLTAAATAAEVGTEKWGGLASMFALPPLLLRSRGHVTHLLGTPCRLSSTTGKLFP